MMLLHNLSEFQFVKGSNSLQITAQVFAVLAAMKDSSYKQPGQNNIPLSQTLCTSTHVIC